jgi:hypothetical protein
MTSVEKVAHGIAAGWKQIAAESGSAARKVERVVRAAVESEQAEYREAARLYRSA